MGLPTPPGDPEGCGRVGISKTSSSPRKCKPLHPSLGCRSLGIACPPYHLAQQSAFGGGLWGLCPFLSGSTPSQICPSPGHVLGHHPPAVLRKGVSPAVLTPRGDKPPPVLPQAGRVSLEAGGQQPPSHHALPPACSQRPRERMPLPRNAKMLSTKQSRADKAGPAAENVDPEKVSTEPCKGCRRGSCGAADHRLLTPSIAGGELSCQEVFILTPGQAQEEISVRRHHQCEYFCEDGGSCPCCELPMAGGAYPMPIRKRRGLPAGHILLSTVQPLYAPVLTQTGSQEPGGGREEGGCEGCSTQGAEGT